MTAFVSKIFILFLIPTFALVHSFFNFGIDVRFIKEIGLLYSSFLIVSIGSFLLAEKYFKKADAFCFISLTIFSFAFFSFLPIDLYFSGSRLRTKLVIWLTSTVIILVFVLWRFRKRPLTVTFALVCLMYTSLLPSLHASQSISLPWTSKNYPTCISLW